MRITVTKNKQYRCHGYLLVQNVDCRLQNTKYRPDTKYRLGKKCRLQSGYKRQTENLKCFFVWFVITCHLTTYRASRNRFSTISFHDYLHYCGILLARFLIKIVLNIILSLQSFYIFYTGLMLDMLHSYMSVVYIYYYRGVFKNYVWYSYCTRWILVAD